LAKVFKSFYLCKKYFYKYDLMKIAYLSTFYPFRGGITHFNHSLLKAFNLNHEAKAFTFKRQYPDLLFPGKTQYVTDEDIIEQISAKRVLDTINPFSYIKTANEIRKFNPDLLVMKYWMPFFAPSLGYVAGNLKKKSCKVISILDNVVPHEKKFYDIPFSKYFLQRNSGFVVMSDTVKNDLLQLKPDAKFIEHEHPFYNHFGNKIDRSEACHKLGIPENKKIILFFGFVRDYKGLDILIETMKYLSDDYYLVIAGEVYGDEKKYFELIERNNIANSTQVNLRYIADHEVSLFFSAADVNVLPYKSATQSGILAIAYHFELPVIVTDVGSLKAAVENENTGLVAEKADPKILKSCIESYFNLGQKEKYVSNIRQLKDKNSWEKLANSIVEFSENI